MRTNNRLNSNFHQIAVVDANKNIKGITLTGQSDFGDVANISIHGGSSSQFLQTDGSGNLVWADANTPIVNVPHISWTATDGQTEFTSDDLAEYSPETPLSIFRNGVLMSPEEYSVSGNTLTISTYLIAEDMIEIPSRGVVSSGGGGGGGAAGIAWSNTASIAVGDLFAGQTLSPVSPGSSFTPTATQTVLPIQVDNPSLNTQILAVTTDPVTKTIIGVGGTVGTPSLALIMRSTDNGKSWTKIQAPSGATQSYYGIGFADTPAGRTFLACGISQGQIMYSRDDGLTWTVGATGAPASGQGQYTVTYSPPLNMWLIGGQAGWVSRSTDLVTWTRSQIQGGEFKNYRAIAWVPSINKFFAPYTVNNFFSSDGVTWTMSGINYNDKSTYGIAINGDRVVICGSQGLLGTTTDFVTWNFSPVTSFPTLPLFGGVSYNAAYGMYFATGQSGWFAFSTDGINWTPVNIFSNTISTNAVTFADDGFISVANQGLILRCNVVENSVYTAEMVKVPSGTYKCLGQTSGYGGVYSRMYGGLWTRTT